MTRTFLLAVVLAGALGASQGWAQTVDDAGTAPSAPAVDPPRPAVVLNVGLAAGYKVGAGAVGFGQLSLSFRVWEWIEPEIIVGAGGHNGGFTDVEPYVVDGESLQRFGIGARLQFTRVGPRPFVWLAFHHGHATALPDFLKSPVLATLSSSEAGTLHLSGAELGVGSVLPFEVELRPVVETPVPVELVARATAIGIPAFLGSDPQHRIYLVGELGLAVPFTL